MTSLSVMNVMTPNMLLSNAVVRPPPISLLYGQDMVDSATARLGYAFKYVACVEFALTCIAR